MCGAAIDSADGENFSRVVMRKCTYLNPRGPTFFVKIAIFYALAGNVKLEVGL